MPRHHRDLGGLGLYMSYLALILLVAGLGGLGGCASVKASAVTDRPSAPPTEMPADSTAASILPPYANFRFIRDELVGDLNDDGIVLAIDLSMLWQNRGKRSNDLGGTLEIWARPGEGGPCDYLPGARLFAEPVDPNHPIIEGTANHVGYWYERTPSGWRPKRIRVEEPE